MRTSGLSALGAKVRSLSSGPKKAAQPGQLKTTPSPPLPVSSPSGMAQTEEARRASRSSRLFGGPSGKARPETTMPAQESAEDDQGDGPSEEPPSGLRHSRLSFSGLSGHFSKSPSQSSPVILSSTLPLEASTSQGDFNLRSFRNVRRQSSTASVNDPTGARPPSASPVPFSSASIYTSPPQAPSRQESFVSAEEYLSRSATSSPLHEDASARSPAETFQSMYLPSYEGKNNSPRSEAIRTMGGSISAGRFRKVTASSRNLDSGASSPREGSSTPTDATNGGQRSVRPVGLYNNLTTSPGQTLATLEAEMAKGRTTPLMFYEEQQRKGLGVALGTTDVRDRESSYFSSLPGGGGSGSAREESQHIAPPKLPWMREEDGRDSADRRRLSSFTGTNQGNGALYWLKPAVKSEELLAAQPVVDHSLSDNRSNTPTVDTSFLASAVQASPSHPIFASSPLLGDGVDADNEPPENQEHSQSKPSNARKGVRQRENRRSTPVLTNAKPLGRVEAHRRGASLATPMDFKSASTVWPGHRRSMSSSTESARISASKAEDLLLFHKHQAASLSAAQSRTEIQPLHAARIAWPSPPCVRLDYFSHLSAMHQHSLFEQHRKAADHALAEYLRLMAGVVPLEAMIQPGPLFASEAVLPVNGSKDARHGANQHNRSRSISVPGLHGGSQHARRRSVATVPRNEPVPPLPTETMLEKLKERAHIHSTSSPYNGKRIIASSPSSSQPAFDSGSATSTERPNAKYMAPNHLHGVSAIAHAQNSHSTSSAAHEAAAPHKPNGA